jgi:micrococcal nuclease
MTRKKSLVVLAVQMALAASVLAQTSKPPTITASEAKDHIGQVATVCGKVMSARYNPASRGSPTFLNLDRPYPDQLFTVVIWGTERAKFGKPEVDYKDKRICVTGKIETYREIPQVVAKDPSQIKIEAKS